MHCTFVQYNRYIVYTVHKGIPNNCKTSPVEENVKWLLSLYDGT